MSGPNKSSAQFYIGTVKNLENNNTINGIDIIENIKLAGKN
jgi:hypothetical protein